MPLHLIFANLFSRKTRLALTVLAIGLSVSLVVAMTSGFSAFQNASGAFFDKLMGAVDASVFRGGDRAAGISADWVEQIRADPRVKIAFARVEGEAPLAGVVDAPPAGAMGMMAGKPGIVGVDRPNDPLLSWLKLNAGRWFEPGEKAAVIDQVLADRYKLSVGQAITVTGQHGTLEMPIVGIVHLSGAVAMMAQSKIYVPIEEARAFVFGPAGPAKVSRVQMQFRPGVNGQAFSTEWNDRLKAADNKLRLKLTSESRADRDKNFFGLRMLSSLGGAVAMLSATFIIFSTLSMGVSERQRTLAMLRAIGATRRQIGAMVVTEGVGISALGVLLGVPLGFGFSAIIVAVLATIFPVTPTLDWLGVAMASTVAMLAALAASALPAWQATRVDPLEAMSAQASPTRAGFPWRSALIALPLIATDPLLLHLPVEGEWARSAQFFGHFAIGLPAMMLGFFLLAPSFVWTITHVGGRVLAWLLRVPFALIHQQLSGGLWQAAGTSMALMVGLSTLIVMQTHGRSALAAWKLPDRFPDLFVFAKGGLTPDSQRRVIDSPLLKPEDTMAIGIFAPEVSFMGIIGTQIPGATMFVAVDPEKVFRIMELDFRQGNAAEATELLKRGRHVVVTDEFNKLRNLGLGDKLALKTLGGPEIEYTIAGVVWSPGLDVMVNSFDMGAQFEQQSSASVFGTHADAKQDFNIENVNLMCANIREFGVPREQIVKQLQEALGAGGLTVADTRALKHSIQTMLQRLLHVASLVAWGALAIASLGVVNTIIASIRSRMWQFGVLRSVGLTRFALLRVVLAEALLLGCVGSALGLAAGFIMTLDARTLMATAVGNYPPLVIPWDVIGLGVGVVIAISLLSSLIPAWRVSMREPLGLLQAGRSTS
ncbi:MAG TPA: ABC transporter permease [Tepidisphaeraceae bacterium]